MKTAASRLALALVVGLSPACHKQPEPIPRETPAELPVSSAAAGDPHADPHANPHADLRGRAVPSSTPVAAGPSEIAYDSPASWTSAPNPSPMRKATFKIPKAGGDAEDAELAISAASGGVEPNVKRWEQQFGDAKAKTEVRTINGLKVTVVELKGTYASGAMMGQPAPPKANQMLLGAIVDAGDSQHFFKMTGGEKTVTAARKDFDKFVSTFRGK